MQMHEYFEELGALAAIGQLTAEEHQELILHLRTCGTCRRTVDDFALILEQLPVTDPPNIARNKDRLLTESVRRRFLTRAAAEGIRFSSDALVSSGARLLKFPDQHLRRAAIVAAAAACILAAFISIRKVNVATHANQPIQISSTASLNDPRSSNVAPQNEFPAADRGQASKTSRVNGDSERQLMSLNQQLAQALREGSHAQVELERLRQQIAALQAQSDAREQALSAANAELQKLENDEAQMVATLVAKEDRIQELAEDVKTQTAAAERERQLSAVAKDIREMMAARNLHIIDVYDFDGRGKRDRSFGRVFYVENKSLIFYAFDLKQKGPQSKVTFQAWGQREDRSTTVKNLGVFYVDHDQKQWVLRVNDSKLLSSIDSVFVTVEPFPGSDTPSGRKLLYGYLGTQANHP